YAEFITVTLLLSFYPTAAPSHFSSLSLHDALPILLTNSNCPPNTLLTLNVKLAAGVSSSVAAKSPAVNTTGVPSVKVKLFTVNRDASYTRVKLSDGAAAAALFTLSDTDTEYLGLTV